MWVVMLKESLGQRLGKMLGGRLTVRLGDSRLGVINQTCNKLKHTDAVVSFESFRALKLTLFESFRILKSYHPI